MAEDKNHKHHILSHGQSLFILLFLLVFTAITVLVAQFDFGTLNFPIAMLIASIKAFAVMAIFMGLRWDDNENRAIFLSGFAFLGIFIFFVATDFFSRSTDMNVVGEPLAAVKSDVSFENPWVPQEEIVEYGKELYSKQACQTCHGDEGYGDGPAGVALNARNFHESEGWKNGRSIDQIYKTLSNGLGSMPSYSTLPPVDRLALAQYVMTFGSPPAEAPSDEALQEVGIDPSKPDGGFGGGGEPKITIPVDFAIDRYVAQP